MDLDGVPPLVLLLGSVGGRIVTRRDWSARGGRGLAGGDGLGALGDQEPDDDGETEDGEEPGPRRAGSSTSGSGSLRALLRHEGNLPQQTPGAHPGWLDWITYNRVWLVPYVSAVAVVAVEVLVGLLAERGLPAPAHAALGWFVLFAVGRGRSNRQRQKRHEHRRADLAQLLGVPEHELADEFAEFMAWRDLPGGDDHG